MQFFCFFVSNVHFCASDFLFSSIDFPYLTASLRISN